MGTVFPRVPAPQHPWNWACLLTFDNRRNSLLVLMRVLFVNNEIYKPFILNSRAQGVSEKMNNLYLNSIARGRKMCEAQCSCIGLRLALHASSFICKCSLLLPCVSKLHFIVCGCEDIKLYDWWLSLWVNHIWFCYQRWLGHAETVVLWMSAVF